MKPLTLLLILTLPLFCRAQSCQGGLGDPIVQYTFGSGTATYGPALTAGITNLTYQQSLCPQQSGTNPADGGYAIVHQSGSNCYPGDWLVNVPDHTGDLNGYYMLINASTNPNQFYNQTVSGLCANTTYQFAAWVVNMASHAGELDPNITFTIEQTDGTAIATGSTGDIGFANPAQWKQYAFYFTTPPGVTSVVLKMINTGPGGYGNDLGLDDITFRTSGPTVKISMAGHGADSAMFCTDPANVLQMTGIVGGCYASTAYQWQQSADRGATWQNVPGATALTYNTTPTAVGSYWYRLATAEAGNISNAACFVASAPDSAVVLPVETPAVSIDMSPNPLCADSVATFTASGSGTETIPAYAWTVNGAPVGTGQVFSGALAQGDQVQCMMTSSYVCVTTPTAQSNTVSVQTIPDIAASVSAAALPAVVCEGSPVEFTATPANGGAAPVFAWTVDGRPAGSDAPTFTTAALHGGDVVGVTMTSSLRCTMPASSGAVPLTVYDTPMIRLTADTVIGKGGSALLHPVVTGDYTSFTWEPVAYLGEPNQLQTVASPVYTTTYTLTMVNGPGCASSAPEKVEVFYGFVMPDAFTPNGDGHNDVYRIPLPLSIERFSIYDRWGKVIFQTNDSNVGWDGTCQGKLQPIGTYVWMVVYDDPLVKKWVQRKGFVALIR
ncbi:MAG TPA: T9SS type B sorting domain-containing protein [Dinghuibacter sp.]|jgi:gliding motility-associated-like protein|uniref:T9SS type B sorting domain-containing protein n=1 Tax=Dinghuibacter sp. TaxID=2024697 RepID=UPI002BE2D01D|nr:T9SS type B sorting domain-containing protein [Dinghuibacter sp.]HTJ13661.1 T9SS type B sorting domain-containing protein [Dinghuibacter sp.]